jgi:UDPglucose 6-dehydrogenase
MNEYQESRFVARMLKAMFNTIAGKKIAILGFAFKADTGDTRESPAIKVCKELLQENAIITISDPQALKSAKRDLADVENIDNIIFEADPYKAAEGAHAIALLTDWRNYKELDFNKIYETMEKPAFFFDGRNHINSDMLYDIGFNVYTIGQTEKTHI